MNPPTQPRIARIDAGSRPMTPACLPCVHFAADDEYVPVCGPVFRRSATNRYPSPCGRHGASPGLPPAFSLLPLRHVTRLPCRSGAYLRHLGDDRLYDRRTQQEAFWSSRATKNDNQSSNHYGLFGHRNACGLRRKRSFVARRDYADRHARTLGPAVTHHVTRPPRAAMRRTVCGVFALGIFALGFVALGFARMAPPHPLFIDSLSERPRPCSTRF